jgi:hypothetical protein
MTQFVRGRLIAILLAVTAVLGVPSLARADFVLVLSDGIHTEAVQSTSGDFINFHQGWNGYSVTVSAQFVQNSGANSSQLFSYTLDVLRGDQQSGDALSVYLGVTNVTMPTGSPVTVNSSMAATVYSTLANAPMQEFSYGSFLADDESHQLNPNDPSGDPLAGFTQVGLVSASLPAEFLSYASQTVSGEFAKDGEFALAVRSELTITRGVTAQLIGQTEVLPTPAPQPSTLVLGFMGAVPLLVGGWLRRRRPTVVN